MIGTHVGVSSNDGGHAAACPYTRTDITNRQLPLANSQPRPLAGEPVTAAPRRDTQLSQQVCRMAQNGGARAGNAERRTQNPELRPLAGEPETRNP